MPKNWVRSCLFFASNIFERRNHCPLHSSVQINDKNIDDVQYLEPYTLYINPYYVVTELQGGDKVSKHYYMNTQRVATDISINYQAQESMAGPQQPNARDPKKPSEDIASVNYNAAFADLQATLNALGHQKLDVNGLGQQPTLEQYYPELVRETAFSTTAAKNAPESTTRVLFWYHPDYLGNVDLVTERDGKTYEFFTYNPWGEEMHQYNANTFSFSSPYRFNSKEKDQETGLHYYGARYYQSKLSVWLSVDPLAHKTLEPFIFTRNNPIMFIDPDGRDVWEIDEAGNAVFVRESNGLTINGQSMNSFDWTGNVKAFGQINQHYADKAGVKGDASHVFIFNENGAIMNDTPIEWDHLRKKPQASQAVSEQLGNGKSGIVASLMMKDGELLVYDKTDYSKKENLMNTLVHEGRHLQQNRNKYSAWDELDVILYQVQHSTWKGTSIDYKAQIMSYAEKNYNHLMKYFDKHEKYSEVLKEYKRSIGF